MKETSSRSLIRLIRPLDYSSTLGHSRYKFGAAHVMTFYNISQSIVSDQFAKDISVGSAYASLAIQIGPSIGWFSVNDKPLIPILENLRLIDVCHHLILTYAQNR